MKQHRARPLLFTGKLLLGIVGFTGMLAAGIFWWRLFVILTSYDYITTLAVTTLLVLAPVAIWCMLLPFSPGAMLFLGTKTKTWGMPVVLGCGIYLLYYEAQLLWSYWAAQEVVAKSGLVNQQVILCIIGYVLIPALVWSPVSGEELVEAVRQQQLVARYELQTQADIAILRATLLRAQEKALVGFANLTVKEREELAAVMRSLVGGIEKTMYEIGDTVKAVSGITIPFNGMLEDNEDIRDVLGYISESLTSTSLTVQGGENSSQEVSQGGKTPARLPKRQRMVTFRLPSSDKVFTAPVVGIGRYGDVIIQTERGEKLIPSTSVLELDPANN